MAKRLRKKSIAEEMRDRATGNNQTYTVEERKDVAIPKQDMTPTPTLQDRINKHYIENMQNLANTTMNVVTNTVKRNPIVNSFMVGFNTGKNVELPQNQVKTIQNAVKKDLQTNTQDKRNPYTIMQDKNNQKKEEEEKHKENVSYKPYQLPQAQDMVSKNQQEVDERKKNEEAQGLLSQVQNRTLPQAQKQEEVKKPTLKESIEEYLRTGDIRKSAGNYFKSQFEGGKQGAIEFGQYYNETLPSKVEGDSWTKRKSEEQYRAKEYREGLLNDVKQNPNNYSKEQKSFIKNQQEFTEKYGDNFYEAYKNESKEKVNKMIEEAPTEIDRKLIEIGQSNGRSTVGAGFSMLSPVAGTMYFYGSSAQSYYDSALEMGMAESDAWKYANVMGAWETVSEELIAANRVDQVNKILTGSNIGKTGMKFLGNSMVENAFQEALSEPIDDITKSMLNYSYLNEGQLGERMLESGMIGAISALLMDSPTAVLSAPGDIVNLYNKSVEKIGKKATIEKMQKGAETYYAQILSEINNGLGNDAYEMMRNQNIQEENELSRLLPGEYENQQEIDRTRDEKLKAITEDMTEGDKTAYLIQNSNLSQEEKNSLSRVARRLNVSAEQIDDLLKFNEEQKQIQNENNELEQMIDNSNLSQAQIGEVLSQKSFEEAKNKINELTEENNANQEAIKTLGLNISEENKEGNILYKEKQNIEINDSDTLESSYKKYFGENETSFVKKLKNLDKAAIESGQNVKLVFDGNYFKDNNGNILTGVEAAFVTKDGKRTIAVNPYATTGKAFEQVLAHELTHAVLSEENADTQALYKSVQDYLTSKGEYDNIVKDLKGLYGKNYNEEEVVAKTIERLFNSKEELNSLANSNPNIFTRIYRNLVGLYAKITGSEKAYIKKLKLDMELAWKNSNNKGSLQDSVKNSINGDGKDSFYRGQEKEGDLSYNSTGFQGLKDGGYYFTTNKARATTYGKNLIEKFRDEKNTVTVKESDELQKMATEKLNEHMKEGIWTEEDDLLEQMALGRSKAFAEYTGKPFVETGDKFGEENEAIYYPEFDIDKTTNKLDIENIKNKYSDKTDHLILNENDDYINIDNLVVKKDLRNQGIGQQILDDIINYGNETGKTITLTPTSEFGTKERLKKWYKANGFVENKGKNTDFTISDTMYKRPDTIKYSMEDSQGRKLTKEQQEYFKDSKVRDENGKLLLLHHGTDVDFNTFEHQYIGEDNKDGLGFYFTPNELQFEYDNPKTVYVNITNPATDGNLIDRIIRREEELLETIKDKKQVLEQIQKEFNVDGIIDKNRNNIVAFNSNQIKNIDNKNPTTNPDIRYSIESKKYLEEEFERLTGDSFQRAEAKLGGMALRNAQRQANNLESELEGYPYSDEAMKLYRRIENSKSTSSYLYHSTPRDRLASILQNGLTIGNEQNQAGVSANDRLYLAATEDLAESFTPNDSITFRINPRQYNNLENFESDLLGGEGSYSITNNIPANMLQVKENGKWVNLEKSKLAKETNTSSNIKYSMETTTDNDGNKLSKGQREYFNGSKAVDENGNLVKVYHTTGGYTSIAQFNEFDPRGDEHYKFGNQIVNYYTDDKDMSGSYADQNYREADTKKLENIDDVKEYLNTFSDNYSYNIEETEDGKYELKINSQNKAFEEALDKLAEEDEETYDRLMYKVMTEGVKNAYDLFDNEDYSWEGSKNPLNQFLFNLNDSLDYANPGETNRELINYMKNMYGNTLTFENKDDLLRNVKARIQEEIPVLRY